MIDDPPFDSIDFDGHIRINNGPVGAGRWVGTINIVGCHATTDDLNICIGGDSGTLNILQDDCTNQVVEDCETQEPCE